MHQPACNREIAINIKVMAQYDFVFAKAKYSQALAGSPVRLNNECRILIKEGRHPLLGRNATPLDFKIGQSFKALVITGPNTGGKDLYPENYDLNIIFESKENRKKDRIMSKRHVPGLSIEW